MPEPSIIILDGSIASKIAAGEVIERPASVIKELVENSLDAGARNIEIEVEEGGQRLLRVKDDGIGMSAQDAILALQRHATSKIRAAEDLFSVRTLGFRGEALPSIAAVSHFEMVTCAASDHVGTQIIVHGSEITAVEEVGTPVGTRISVSGLFYNTPARLKFLRSQATEFAHIAELVNRFSFSHHHLSFLLKHNGREVLRRPASPDLREPLARVLGRDNAAQMIEIKTDLPLARITGYISGVQQQRATRNQQYFFVNRRWIRSRMMTRALEEAYHTLLPLHRYPVAVLLLDLDPSLVDVNVHPTKAEVRFSREGEIYVALKHAIEQALSSAGFDATAAPTPLLTGSSLTATPDQGSLLSLPRGVTPASPAAPVMPASANEIHPALRPGVTDAQPQFRPLAQLRSTYILAEGESGLLVVDQHRAHERVLYEQFMRELAGTGQTQALLTPATVNLGAREAAILKDNLADLTVLGFGIEEFGADCFLVRAIPTAFLKKDPVRLLTEIVEDLATTPDAQLSSTGQVSVRRERALITMSCKAAVKAGDPLGLEEMARLLDDLSATNRPYTCPHGRPTVMTISNFELDRKFHR
jgi:DNA mismatch repair protein MutL